MKRAISVVLMLLCVIACEGAPLTVRVDTSAGVPRITVNGVPKRARVFYGQPASGRLPVTSTGRVLTFDFAPELDEPGGGTMHFRFGQTPGDVFVDDIRVVDLQTGKDAMQKCEFEGGDADFARDWNVWPIGERNTVGTLKVEPGVGSGGSAGLHVHIAAPKDGVWPDFHFHHTPNLALRHDHRYRVSFWAKAVPDRDLTVAFYRPGTRYVFLGGPPGHYDSQVRLAAGAGVTFVSFSVPLPWPAPGEPLDWAEVDSVCETTLRANPHALMIPRIPVYVPDWWKRSHLDEMMRWEDGLHDGCASPASLDYRREASERLSALVRHLESRYGDHIAGYHPNGQNTGEWFYMDSWNHPLNGYAPCDTAAFRAWLRKKYSTLGAFRAAWRQPEADFEFAFPPTPAQRHAAPNGVFRDPATEQPIVDFTEFQQESMADCVCELAKVVRQATAGRKLVLFFYGYVFEFGAMPTGPGCSGHYALRRILDCPDIDIVCSPISYFDRGPGESAPCMSAAESVALAKKMWLNEDDTRTFLTHESEFPGAEHVVNTLGETVGELRRNVAQEALRNFATWWMDLPASGWFDDPGLWAEMARLSRLDEPLLRNPIPFHPAVAAVIDERSMTRVAEGGQVVTGPCVYEARAALGRMGAPYGQYLLDDVARGRVQARLYAFLNAWLLSAETRTALLRATRGATRIWCYAPGCYEGDHLTPEAMRELTGFALKPVSPESAWATPTELGKKMGLTKAFGVHHAVRPLFAASDATPAEILATYPDGSVAVALRRTPTGPSLFVGAPGLTSELLRIACRTAGVQLYTNVDCNVYANGPYVAFHAAQDGTLALDTGRSGTVGDVLTGATVGRGPTLTINVRKGETRVLRTTEERARRRRRRRG